MVLYYKRKRYRRDAYLLRFRSHDDERVKVAVEVDNRTAARYFVGSVYTVDVGRFEKNS